jgi:hypothetical protein
MSTVALLLEFAHKRPGLEFGNYGCHKAYTAEVRAITRQLHDARKLLRACELLSVSDEDWSDAMRTDRLKVSGGVVDFSCCQYWPTEYRLAVCRVAAGALWSYFRGDGATTREAIQSKARHWLPRSIVRRWFN